MEKGLGQRTPAELEELFANMYSGWERGVVITQERHSNGDTDFSERPMTSLELAARYVAAEIGANIYEIAGRAAFAPIITFSQIQARIGPVFDDIVQVLEDAERFMAYFSGETNGVFIGDGMPSECLAKIRAAITKTKQEQP